MKSTDDERTKYFGELAPVTEAEIEELKMELLTVIMDFEGLEGYKPPWWKKGEIS